MVDLPEILEEKAKEKNQKILEKLFLHIAANNRSLEEAEFKKFMNSLSKGADQQQKGDTFDREKFEELRLLTNMGANKLG